MTTLGVLLALALAGCGGGRHAGGGAPPAAVAPSQDVQARPLAALAGREVVLLPVQRVEVVPGLPAEAVATGTSPALVRAVDSELVFALRERGLEPGWTAADAIRGLAGRNPAMGLTPDRLPLPPDREMRGGAAVREPLAGQLRSIAALAGARYAVVPLAIVLSGADGGAAPAIPGTPGTPGARGTPGTVRAVLHLALVDVRAAQLLWMGDTAPLELPSDSPALAARLAGRFADLIAPPGAD